MRPVITTDSDDHIGLAVIRSLGRNTIDFQTVSRSKNTLAWYSRYCTHKTIGRFDLDFFRNLSKNDIVFPMYEDLMLLLAQHAAELPCQLAFSSYETLQTATNKSLLIRHAMEHNIPCPKTFFINQPEDIGTCASEIEFPVVLKPERGSGGTGIEIVESPDLLLPVAERTLKNHGPFLLQEKIPFTTKYTIGALCNFEHELRRVCVIKELRNFPVDIGQACYVETVEEPRLVAFTENLLKSLNFVGVADIDLVIDTRNGQPRLMEINPRFWGSMQVAINAGADFPKHVFTLFNEGDIEKDFSYAQGCRCRYLFSNDLRRLITVMKSDRSGAYKRETLGEFLKFPKNECFYVFSKDDIGPLLGLASIKLTRAARDPR